MNTESSQAPALTKPVRKKRLWPKILLGIVILICGIMIGAAGTMAVVNRFVRTVFERPEDLPVQMAKRMKRQLDLSDNQAIEVEKILDKRIGNVIDIMHKVSPQLHEEFLQMHDEISKVLTGEQQRIWEKRYKVFKRLLPPEGEDTDTEDDAEEQEPSE